jgi:hypothetical protein
MPSKEHLVLHTAYFATRALASSQQIAKHPGSFIDIGLLSLLASRFR